jgi:hypothetical protein
MTNAKAIYPKIRSEFLACLKTVGFEKCKEGILRRTITLHSFRRYVKTYSLTKYHKIIASGFLVTKKSILYA